MSFSSCMYQRGQCGRYGTQRCCGVQLDVWPRLCRHAMTVCVSIGCPLRVLVGSAELVGEKTVTGQRLSKPCECQVMRANA